MRLRHVAHINPPKPFSPHLTSDTEVSFAPMDALSQGVGGLDTSITRRLGEVSSGSYNYFADGDLLLSKVTPCFENGKKAIADGLTNGIGFATSEVYVIRPRSEAIDRRYLIYVFSSETFRAEGIASMTGASGLRRVSENAILNYRIPVTDLPTQKRIADSLDRETGRIDELIENKQRLVELLKPKWEALFHKNRPHADLVRFGYVAEKNERPIMRDDEELYVPLGLLNRGRGLFHKDQTPGSELGQSVFSWVKEGDLIFSVQFAWEGAVALAGPNENGTIVSHRYHLYRGKRGVRTPYLYAYFRTEPGQFILSESSRGAAGRNRPLSANMLEKEKVPILSTRIQDYIGKLVYLESILKSKMAQSVGRLREFRSTLITAAVTGQIDVEAWAKRGDTDRRLDAIEERMHA